MTTISPQNGSLQNASLTASGPGGEVATSDAPQNSSRRRPTASRRADSASAKAKARRMHRISTVRQRQGVSLRSVARQMRIDVRRLRARRTNRPT